MLKLFGRFVILRNLLFFIVENLFILGVVLLAISIRHSFLSNFMFSLEDYFGKAFLISVVFQLCLYYNDLYVMDEEIKGRKLILRLTQSLGIGCVILIVIYYIYSPASIGRISLFTSAFCLFLIFFSLRLFYFKIIDSLNQTEICDPIPFRLT